MTKGRPSGGVLFDLDGVLYVGDELIPGGQEALEACRAADLPFRFITNTSTKTRAQVAEKLQHLGFDVAANDVFSAVSATLDFLSGQGAERVHLLVRDSVRAEFSAYRITEEQPDYVVVGDIGAAWSYHLLNRVFGELMNGAELVAMHKNKYFQTGQGLEMDIGAFVAGLEFVTGKEATVIGKPSRPFFVAAANCMGVAPEELVVVGDDIESDIGGARRAGMRGVLVRTGKFRESVLESSEVEPDGVIDSVADFPAWLGE